MTQLCGAPAGPVASPGSAAVPDALTKARLTGSYMNLQENFGDGEAALEYRDADFQVVRPGGFVRCAITGAKIPLEALRYWNVDRQEAYIDAAAALKGFGHRIGQRGQG